MRPRNFRKDPEMPDPSIRRPGDLDIIQSFAESRAPIQISEHQESSGELTVTQQAKYLTKGADQFKTFYGGPEKYKTRQELWVACRNYFIWCDQNPHKVGEIIRSGVMAGVEVFRTVPRPFILEELVNHLGVSMETYNLYRTNKYHELNAVCEFVDNEIKARKLSGAYTGQYNAVIAQRDMNMVEKVQTESHSVVEHVVTGMRIIESSEE